jgi:hypothetical protein
VIGPCFSVILPALWSIFLTSPVALESCATPGTAASVKASIAVAAVKLSFFMSSSLSYPIT